MRLARVIGCTLAALAVAAASASAAAPRVAVKPARVAEGDAGDKTVRVRLTLNRRAPAGAQVRYRTRSGSAGAADYRSRAGRIRFRRGSRRAAIVLRIRGDAVAEPDETFSVRLSKPRRVRLGRRRTASIAIVDDDRATLTAAAADVTATEPASGGADSGLAVVLSGPATGEARVDYEMVAGSAAADDVDLTRGTLTFAPGESRKAVPGSLRGDDLDELDETATLRLTNSVGLRIADPEATLTIQDDPGDLPPSLSINDTSLAEGAGPARLTVALSRPSGRPVAVTYATKAGTADGADFPPAAANVVIPPGAKSAGIDLGLTDDARDEDAQVFSVVLSQPDGATIADGEGVVVIEDDDPAPTVSIDDHSLMEANAAAAFAVTLSAPSEKTVTLRADTLAGTASGGASCSPGIDFLTLANTPLTFMPGEVVEQLDVTVCEDALDEQSSETATVQLSQLANATPADPSGLLTILDDED